MVSTDQCARNFFVPVYISWTVYTNANYPYPAALAARPQCALSAPNVVSGSSRVGGVARAAGTCRLVVRTVGPVLLGDSVIMQWVPSHVGVQGHKRADERAVRELAQAFREVLRDREVRDIWHELGLEEIERCQ